MSGKEPTEHERAISMRNAIEIARKVSEKMGTTPEQIEADKRVAADTAVRSIFSDAQFKQIKKWIAAADDPSIDLREAIRRLVESGLRASKERR
jgi:hypothetical protein